MAITNHILALFLLVACHECSYSSWAHLHAHRVAGKVRGEVAPEKLLANASTREKFESQLAIGISCFRFGSGSDSTRFDQPHPKSRRA